MSIKIRIAAALKILAKQQGKTVGEILKSAGLHPNVAAKIRRGRRGLDIDEADRIASALNFPNLQVFLEVVEHMEDSA